MASQINPGSMIAIASALPAVCILIVGSRFYIRVTNNHGLSIDDWLILPALIMVIGIGISIIIGVKQQALGYPTGGRSFPMVAGVLAIAEKIEFGVYMLSQWAVCFSKLSLLFFYRRVFYTGSNKSFDVFTKILAAIILLWSFAEQIEFIFHCGTQVHLHWDGNPQLDKQCANGTATNLFLVSFDVLLDLILFVTPIPFLVKLQLSKSRRFGLVFVFAIGSLAVITSIIRLVIFALVFSVKADSGFIGQDLLIIVSLYFYWTMFEAGTAVIVTCLPVLQIWFRKASVETVRRNVLGIFSVVSFTRSSQKSAGSKYHHGPDRTDVESGHESSIDSHGLTKPIGLDEISQNSVHHGES